MRSISVAASSTSAATLSPTGPSSGLRTKPRRSQVSTVNRSASAAARPSRSRSRRCRRRRAPTADRPARLHVQGGARHRDLFDLHIHPFTVAPFDRPGDPAHAAATQSQNRGLRHDRHLNSAAGRHEGAAPSGDRREHGRHDDRVVRLLPLRHGGGAGLPQAVLPVGRPVGGHPAGVRHAVRRIRRSADRRGDLRPLRRPDRPQGHARHHAADHGDLHRADRRAARLRDDRDRRAAAADGAAAVQGAAVGGEWGGSVLIAMEWGRRAPAGLHGELAAAGRAAGAAALDRHGAGVHRRDRP